MRKCKRKILGVLFMSAMLFSAWPAVYGSEADGGQRVERQERLGTDEEEREISEEEVSQGWKARERQRFYLDSNLERVTGWQKINGNWYYFDEEGWMQTGWLEDGGKRYYLKDNGVMQTGWILEQKQWYFADGTGAMRTGWLHKGGSWFYLQENGAMCTGWKDIGGTWYYFRPGNGDMMTGWVRDRETWYYMSGSGAMQTGWLKHGTAWYYLSGSGAMAKDWTQVRGSWYYLNDHGAMQTGWLHRGNNWFYLNEDGVMQTGWLHRRGVWYYLNRSGAMLTGWQVVGSSWYYFDGDGAMQSGWICLEGSWYYLGGNNDGAMKTGWIRNGGRNYYLTPGGVWKDIRLAVIGNNEAGAITTAAKFVEMGVDATVVTGNFEISRYDGIIIPGGGDLDPARYGQTNTASGNIDNILDERQIDAVKQCVAAGKPIFGICKGVQLINVVFGGTLNQSISGHMGVWHTVSVSRSGWFSNIYSGSVRVLSYHHQSIRDLADGFQADMRAGDGTIEAISNNEKHIYGVQFHPEQMNNEVGNRCIRQFVEVCAK